MFLSLFSFFGPPSALHLNHICSITLLSSQRLAYAERGASVNSHHFLPHISLMRFEDPTLLILESRRSLTRASFIVLALLKIVSVTASETFTQHEAATPVLHSRARVKWLMSRACFPPDVALWITTEDFDSGFTRPQNLWCNLPLSFAPTPGMLSVTRSLWPFCHAGQTYDVLHRLLSFQRDLPAQPAGLWCKFSDQGPSCEFKRMSSCRKSLSGAI